MAIRAMHASECSTSGRDDYIVSGSLERASEHAQAIRLPRRSFANAAASLLAIPLAMVTASQSEAIAAEAPEGAQGAGSFYSKWPYVTPADILPYLEANSTLGDVPSIIRGVTRPSISEMSECSLLLVLPVN